MAILDKVSEFAKNLGDKTGSAIETSNLNSKISTEQNAINAVMTKIGEFYYNKYAEEKTADDGIAEFCKTIDGHNAAIAEAKAEIERIKAAEAAAVAAPVAAGGLVCTVCGAANADGRKFCSECGGKLEEKKPTVTAVGLVCSACGAANAADKKFCGDCGGKLEAITETKKRVCACGAEVAPGEKFCGDCGAKYEEGE
ncbi:MAG: zinc ribbon domain-containing protein [Oscillospiraceae bacterium]|nr:zinc ribbon domain-containing protein [Oscillospiraceae bacterium]